MAKTGDVVFVPVESPHRFVAGKNGGRTIVISPLDLKFYFWKVSELLDKGKVSYDTEFEITKQYGQIFLDNTKHWK